MRLGSCRASLTRPAAPTSEKSDLLKLRLSHRKTGVVIVCGHKFPIGVCASRGESASSKVLVVDCHMHVFAPNRRF